MEIILFSRPGIEHTADELSRLVDALRRHGIGFCANRGFAQEIERLTGTTIAPQRIYDTVDEVPHQASMLVCYGGDGTFLDGVRLLGDRPIPVLGINSGRLGFLANVPKEEIDNALSDIAAGKFKVQPRSMITATGDFPSGTGEVEAFNEFSIQRSGSSMISVEAHIDGRVVATYWGDGVILSTPSGSTAYSLSVGGPVVSPGCDCFVLSPIAPHNLTMRPVVVPDRSEVAFVVRSREPHALATADNLNFRVGDGAKFIAKKSKKQVFLVELQNISFYDTLRNKMMWGIDHRG